MVNKKLEVATILMLFVSGGFLYFLIKYKPFATKNLNLINKYTNMASLITIFAGCLFLTQEISDIMIIILDIIVILVNICIFLVFLKLLMKMLRRINYHLFDKVRLLNLIYKHIPDFLRQKSKWNNSSLNTFTVNSKFGKIIKKPKTLKMNFLRMKPKNSLMFSILKTL